MKAANGTDLPHKVRVEMTFNLIEDDFDHTVKVPFLIAKDSLDMPIVGFNVTEEITKHFESGSSARINGLLLDVLQVCLVLSEERWRPLFSSLHLSLQRNWVL